MNPTSAFATACALALCACRPPSPPPPGGGDAAWASARAEWERAAEDCAARGDHLGASRYLEASLAAGGDEARLLPLLVAAQVRAGRLRAARESVAQLESVDPERPGLAEIAWLLDSLTRPETAPAVTAGGAP